MHTFIIAALSADGFLADKQKSVEKSTTWTSKEDIAFFVKKTKEAKVCVMGSSTYKTIGHPLKDRTIIIYTHSPKNVSNAIPLNTSYDILHTNSCYTTQLSPPDLISYLEKLGHNQAAICGGSAIYTLFMQAGVVNTLYLTYEPILFGQGIPLFNAPFTQKLTLVNTKSLSPQTILNEYNVL